MQMYYPSKAIKEYY